MRKPLNICYFLSWSVLIQVLICVHSENVELKYYEGSEVLFQSSKQQEGAYINFGVYPHWCLGDIKKCSSGISLEFWLNPKSADDNSEEIIILTTGGHTFFSEGAYLTRKYGDQYEFGVSVAHKTWKVSFRLNTGSWAHILAVFRTTSGLQVYVDNVLFNDQNAEPRDVALLTFDPISEVVIGLSNDGAPIKDKTFFQIQHVTVYDKIIGPKDSSFHMNLVYLGCYVHGTSIQSEASTDDDAYVKECRKNCSELGHPVAFMKKNTNCKCINMENMPPTVDDDSCNANNAWKFYRASSLNNSNPYTLNLAVKTLQTRSYVKPYETVQIIIQTNIQSDVTFDIDFGDGTTIQNARAVMSYFWKSDGTFSITAKAKLGIIQIISTVNFTVQDIDEGVKPEVVIVSGIHEQTNLTGEFQLTVADMDKSQCVVNFNDGSSQHQFPITTEYMEIETVDHTYPNFGGYDVTAECQNKYGTTANKTFFISQKFDIPFLYYDKMKQFSISFAGGRDFLSKIEAFRNLESNELLTTKSDDEIILDMNELPPFENLVTFRYDKTDILKRIFFVQTVLGKPMIYADVIDGAWSLITNVTVTIPKGVNVFVNCSFGVGDERLLYIDEANDTVELIFELEYRDLGYYDIFVTISNDLSYEIVQGVISVEVPIESISVSTSNVTSLSDPVNLKIDLNMGYRGPDKVKFEIDHDDGNTRVYNYRSLTTEFTKYTNQYIYRDYGIYTICITASNQISKMKACVLVQVGQNLTYVDVQTTTTARVTTDEYAVVNITSLSGSDITYLVDFGDGVTFIFTDKELNSTQFVMSNCSIKSHIYYRDDQNNTGSNETLEEIGVKSMANNASDSSTSDISVHNASSTGYFEEKSNKNSTYNDSNNESSHVKRLVNDIPCIATRLSNNLIQVKHLYDKQGRFNVKIKLTNKFSSKWATLCPLVYVDNTDLSTCQKPRIVLENLQSSSRASPIARVRSKQLNVKVIAQSTCSTSEGYTYSFKATKNIDNVEVPVDSLCVHDVGSDVFILPAVSLSYGSYTITTTVSPKGFIRQASMSTLYLDIVPSNPYAELSGEKLQSFLVYEVTIVDVSPSRDPDLITNNRDGLEYFVFCSVKRDFDAIKDDSFNILRDKSYLVYEEITFKRTTSNAFFLYEYDECFDMGANDTDEFTVIDGQLVFPSEHLTKDATEFVFKLFVLKEDRINSTYIDVEIRLTNASSLEDLVNNLDNIKDPAALLRATSSISESLKGGDNSSEATEKRTEMKNKVGDALLKNFVGKEKDPKQATLGYGVFKSITENADEVSQTLRSKSSQGVQNSVGNLTVKFKDEGTDILKDAAGGALGAVANVIPKPDKVAHERRRRRRRRDAVSTGDATHDDLAAEGDHYYILLKQLDVQDSEELYYFHDCLFAEKVVTKNPFIMAVRDFHRDMWLKEDILQWDFTDIFSYYAWEWEPFDIEKYINKYCRIIQHRLEMEKKETDKKVSGSTMNSVDNISGLMLGKMQKASDEKKKNRITTSAPYTTTVTITTEGTTTTTVVPTTYIEEEEEDEPPMEIKADGIDLKMQNVNPNATGPKNLGSDKGGINLSPNNMPAGEGGCKVGVKVRYLSPNNIPAGEGGCKVGVKLLVNDHNQFTYGENSDDIKTSLVTIDFSNPCSGEKYKVENTSTPMEISVAGKPEDVPEPAMFKLCTTRDASPDDPKYFNYHTYNITSNDSSIHFVIWPDLEGDLFEIYMKYMDYPNATYYDFKDIVPKDEDSFADVTDSVMRNHMQHTFFPPPHLTSLNGSYKLAVKLKKTAVDFTQKKVCINYTTTIVIGGCKFWDDKEERYRGEGCTVGNKTTKWNTQCWCTHLTSFGGDFAVPPNTIDFNNVWAKFDVADNPAVFSTVIGLIVLYILLLIWARRKDKQDLIKWGATPLEDNLPSDNYHYQITVYTGTRKNSGTKSKVSLIVSGELCDTGVRQLYDGHRKDFPTGSIYNFILSVEQSMGSLSFLRVFHDNTGKGKMKGWFLNQIQITDLQTGERFFFLCDRWLAVEEDDGMVDRILPVASLQDLAAFKQLFNSSVRKKLTSDHLWFSVFSRPTRSSFTRVQRISCCMSLLFMTMITNAMWFKSDENAKQTNALKIGPVSFTLQQVFVSFASTMIVFPVNFILITFFRRCRPKKNSVLQKNQRITQKGKWKNVTSGSQLWGAAPKRSLWKKFKDSVDDLINSHQRSKYQGTGEEKIDDPEEEDALPPPRIAGDPDADKKVQEKKKKKPSSLPHWCIYIAWVLCFFSIITPGFFTILYSMEWGKEKANKWLTTFLMSFFQSVIVVQPLKVMCIVAFIACILKKPDIDEEDSGEDLNNVIAAHDEDMLGKTNQDLDDIAARRKEANSNLKPPDLEELERARNTRLNELKMEAVIRELAVYVLFVLILFFLSYQQRDSDSFTYATNLKNYFGDKFDSVTTGDQFWSWVDKKLLPALYAKDYINGTRMPFWWDKRCIADLQSRRVGLPRIRQLRVKDNTCKVNPHLAVIIKHCRDEYGWTDDDTKAYYPGWVLPSKENQTLLKEADGIDPWIYANSLKLKNAPYVGTISSYKGGGYTMFLEREINRTRTKLNDLIQQIWVDANTRAIFIEFTVYNPNINLFGSMIMLVEFMSSGGATHRMEFKVFRLLSYVGGLGILVLIFEILYVIFTLVFFVRFVKKVKKIKMKYFAGFWNKLEFALLVFSCAVIAMYAFKHILTAVTISALKNSAKADFVNLQSLALYDEFYGWMCAFVVFLATVQFLKLLQFNKKMNMLGDTISLASKDLKVFFITFTLYFWTFVATGYLLFGNTMLDYASIISSAEATFSFSLGSFDFEAMADSNKVLGPIFFFLFIGIVVVGLMSIFLTILADAFTQVKENVGEQSNDYELVDFMLKRMKGIMGFTSNPPG